MNKDKLMSNFQKLGKVLMAPVLILPISGLLIGIGSAFTNPSLVNSLPFLSNQFLTALFQLMKEAGNVVNNNIPIIFAISIAYGYAKGEKATAALAGFLGYMTMNTIMGSFLKLIGVIDPENLITGQKAILGVITLDTGVFGGIIIGLVVAWLHNRFYKIELPKALSLFNGTRSVPAVTIISSSFVGILLGLAFPPVQHLLDSASDLIISTGAFGAFFYGFAERLLLPFGLHHFIYLPFFFTSLGGKMMVGGEMIEGAVNIYTAILDTPGAMFDISVSRFVMNGKVIFAMCGLPGAALAIYQTAKAENKKQTAALMIAAVIPAALMGITEPLEYSFLFVAPILFIAHAFLSGIAYLLTYLVSFNISGISGFGGPLLSLIFNGILNADKGSNWIYVIPLGISYFAIYYFVFRTLIVKLNLMTPGREEASEDAIEHSEHKKVSALIPEIVAAVGGEANITNVDACFTRLRLTLVDTTVVEDDTYFTKQLNASGIVHVANGVQIIYGNHAALYKTEMREYLDAE